MKNFFIKKSIALKKQQIQPGSARKEQPEHIYEET